MQTRQPAEGNPGIQEGFLFNLEGQPHLITAGHPNIGKTKEAGKPLQGSQGKTSLSLPPAFVFGVIYKASPDQSHFHPGVEQNQVGGDFKTSSRISNRDGTFSPILSPLLSGLRINSERKKRKLARAAATEEATSLSFPKNTILKFLLEIFLKP